MSATYDKLIDLDRLALFLDKCDLRYAAAGTAGEPNVIEVVQRNGTALPVTNKTVNVTVPTAVSQLTNDSDFATEAYVDAAVGSVTGISFEVVQTLPSSGAAGTIYLVPNSGSGTNTYDEYIWITVSGAGRWEKIGTTAVDLSGYVQFSDVTLATNAQINALFA